MLVGLQQKAYLPAETVIEIEGGLKERDAMADIPSTPLVPEELRKETAVAQNKILGKASGSGRADKRQIEQRIEEDRERHKRLREEIWAVGSDTNPDDEFERLRDETSSLGSDDFAMAEEESAERRLALEMG